MYSAKTKPGSGTETRGALPPAALVRGDHLCQASRTQKASAAIDRCARRNESCAADCARSTRRLMAPTTRVVTGSPSAAPPTPTPARCAAWQGSHCNLIIEGRLGLGIVFASARTSWASASCSRQCSCQRCYDWAQTTHLLGTAGMPLVVAAPRSCITITLIQRSEATARTRSHRGCQPRAHDHGARTSGVPAIPRSLRRNDTGSVTATAVDAVCTYCGRDSARSRSLRSIIVQYPWPLSSQSPRTTAQARRLFSAADRHDLQTLSVISLAARAAP